MKLLVSADTNFYKTPDNKYWCKTIYDYEFWMRYLSVFDKINLVSKTNYVTYEFVKDYLRVDGPGLNIIELPQARGMKQYLLNYFKISRAARTAVQGSNCAIFRLPSVPANIVLKHFKKLDKPYALEVVVDPYDAYYENKIAQILFTRSLKKDVLLANGVSYVTKSYLQRKYPCSDSIHGESKNYFQSYYSTINLSEDYFTKPRNYPKVKTNYTLVHTANNVNNNVKGHEIVINVVKRLRDLGYDVNVVFIGDGRKRDYFEALAKRLGVSPYVRFTGLLSNALEVRSELLKGDIFVFPTKAEGLPRAILEAMAVGLPCLSTPVNGIPELLQEEYMFNPKDIDGFVRKIKELIEDSTQLETMSKVNISKAKEYTNDKLTIRRNIFYEKLKKLANEHII